MPFRVTALVFFVLGSSLFAAAQTRRSDALEIELKACLDSIQNQTTSGMCNCTYTSLSKWDKLLNDDYRSLLAGLDKASKGKLVESQRQWLKFREAEAAFLNEYYNKADGTMWRIVKVNKELQFTRDRVLALEEYLTEFDEH